MHHRMKNPGLPVNAWVERISIAAASHGQPVNVQNLTLRRVAGVLMQPEPGLIVAPQGAPIPRRRLLCIADWPSDVRADNPSIVQAGDVLVIPSGENVPEGWAGRYPVSDAQAFAGRSIALYVTREIHAAGSGTIQPATTIPTEFPNAR